MLATWDDHDFGWDNVGGDYPCRAGSQAEFAAHFTVPEWEPLHPAGGQAGVHNSRQFSRPGGGPGLQVRSSSQ